MPSQLLQLVEHWASGAAGTFAVTRVKGVGACCVCHCSVQSDPAGPWPIGLASSIGGKRWADGSPGKLRNLTLLSCAKLDYEAEESDRNLKNLN